MSVDFQLIMLFNSVVAGPAIPPAVSYTKRPQANSVESDQKEEWDKDLARKLGSTTVGSQSEMTASPLAGPEKKKSSTVPSVSDAPGASRFAGVLCCRVFFFFFFVQSLKHVLSFSKNTFQNFKVSHTFK